MKDLLDGYNRRINYLRVSVTDRCNLRCRYCAPIPQRGILSHTDILRYEELLRFIKIGTLCGISKIRITGGEPLVRAGVCNFLQQLKEIPELEDISLTTNGVLLSKNIEALKQAGIRRINISLDTLNPKTFSQITGRDLFTNVWEGIQSALDAGFDPVKLNVVVMKGINDQELTDFAELSIKTPMRIRFIEYMPIGSSSHHQKWQVQTSDIQKTIEKLGKLNPIRSACNEGPARRYQFEHALGEIGFISPMSHHFCSHCNRLRLTASGKLRSCLLSDQELDLKQSLRNGSTDEEIASILYSVAQKKQLQHQLNIPNHIEVKSQMSAIGG